MTTDDFGTVDIDLLADYIGGALDGPQLAEVEQLVATDPQWRETYEQLAPGMVAAGAGLTALGPEPMPADVVARLDVALASPIAAATTIDPELAAPLEPHLEPTPVDGPAAGRHLSLVPETGGDRAAAPAPRKRSRLRWAAPIAAAAGIIAFAGFGASYVAGTQQDDSAESTAAAGSAPEDAAPMMDSQSGVAPAAALADLPPEGLILATGTNYTADILQQRTDAATVSEQARKLSSAAAGSTYAADPELAALQRLQIRDALLACLEAVARQNGGPIQVRNVDFARFQGAPAVIVRFLFDNAEKGWAVGPDCGTPGAGADRL